MTNTRDEYGSLEVAASRSVLLELVRILGEHRDNVIVIGGLVPGLLCPDAADPHSGSMDIDMIVDHRRVDQEAYSRIEDLLLEHGYRRDAEIPSRFIRSVVLDKQELNVPVDLLAGRYSGTGSSHRHQRINELILRKIRGGDIVHNEPVVVEIAGRLPDGSKDTTRCRVVHPVYFVVLKVFAIENRLNNKDCYDLDYVLKHHAGGVDDLFKGFKRLVGTTILTEVVTVLEEKYASPEHRGPQAVAVFKGENDPRERDILARDVFERTTTLITGLRGLLSERQERPQP